PNTRSGACRPSGSSRGARCVRSASKRPALTTPWPAPNCRPKLGAWTPVHPPSSPTRPAFPLPVALVSLNPMTTTSAGPASTEAPSTASLRPGRAETDRLATRINVAEGRELRNVTSPLNGGVLGEVPIGTAEDVEAAVAECRRVQRRWAQVPTKERAAV